MSKEGKARSRAFLIAFNKSRNRNRLIETPCGPMTRTEAKILSGLTRDRLYKRLRSGWPVEMLFIPPKVGQKIVKRRERSYALPWKDYAADRRAQREAQKNRPEGRL